MLESTQENGSNLDALQFMCTFQMYEYDIQLTMLI